MVHATAGVQRADWPGWVPTAAVHYLIHTEAGLPIRALAREVGVHASTILRQVRRFESRRDDPLVDSALSRLATRAANRATQVKGCRMTQKCDLPDTATLHQDALRILRRLAEPGAVLAVAAEMETAVVVRDAPGGGGATRTASVAGTVAQAMALNDWIAADAPGRITRYRITADGRAMLARLIAQNESSAHGLNADDCDDIRPRGRVLRQDPPLLVLARRRETDGTLFLAPDLLAAGERLREDFELARIGVTRPVDWLVFLTDGAAGAADGPAPNAAHARLESALTEMGPGLGDVALRCCCLLEGLESIERRMGWSARSGKVVLRIALQRLRRHYHDTGRLGALMG